LAYYYFIDVPMDSKTIGIAIAALVIGGVGGYAIASSNSASKADKMAAKDADRMEAGMADPAESDAMMDNDMEAGGEEAMEQGMMGGDTIVTLASNTPSLSTLVTAVEAAELVETLNGEGPFTVFAPTNDAFAALPEGTVDTLLMPENQADLQSVLTYHVVPGTYRGADLSDGMTLTTVQGATITIGVHDGGPVTVNDAPVSMADVEASNGVVHVIDSVILPPEMQ
jgi:uncharacterized surface protein with fasciclin (FAS1) repeats